MKRNFITVEPGTTYRLPKYQITDNGLEEAILVESMEDSINISKNFLDISFVRGDKNNRDVPRVDGIVHEQLLAMMISDLQYKNTLVPSKETACAITKLQEALMWLEERTKQREINGTLGTYKN